MSGCEPSGGIEVADFHDGSECSGGIGYATSDRSVTYYEDLLSVEGEVSDVQESVDRHEADEVAVVQPLFYGDVVLVENRVGEFEVPDAVYAGAGCFEAAPDGS